MPKTFSRTDRIGELIQRELAKIIPKEIRDPRVGLVSVAAVRVTRDLSYAKVYITRLGDPAEGKEAVKVLNKASTFLRFHLAQQVQLRAMPQLQFVYDETILTGNALAALIDRAVATDNLDPHKTDDESE